jgi:hypothetical protein
MFSLAMFRSGYKTSLFMLVIGIERLRVTSSFFWLDEFVFPFVKKGRERSRETEFLYTIT